MKIILDEKDTKLILRALAYRIHSESKLLSNILMYIHEPNKSARYNEVKQNIADSKTLFNALKTQTNIEIEMEKIQ